MTMNPAHSSALAAAAAAHPALWQAHQLGCSAVPTTPSGHALLDAQLPGGGWPHRTLTELLLPHVGVGELRLLLPALVALEGSVFLVGPPALPCGWAWAALGLPPQRLVVVQGEGVDQLWALEQALRSGQAAAVLAWLPPRLGAFGLRRLQLAAQAHDGPAFLLRGLGAAAQASPAVLRLALQPAGPEGLRLQVLKRRGPALAEPVHLALPGVLCSPEPASAYEAFEA